MKAIYVGIDVHKKDRTVHVLCQGEAVAHCTIAAECESLIDEPSPVLPLRAPDAAGRCCRGGWQIRPRSWPGPRMAAYLPDLVTFA